MSWKDERQKDVDRKILRAYGDALEYINEQVDHYFNGWDEQGKDDDGKPITIHHKGMYERRDIEAESKAYTDEQFKKWWAAQEGRGEYWLNMRDQVASKLTQFNQDSCSIIRKVMPTVYCHGSNELAVDINGEAVKAKVGISFSLIDEKAVENLLKNKKTVLSTHIPRVNPITDVPWNQEKLQNALAVGIISGDSKERLATRFQSVCNMNRTSAIRNARTSINAAHHAGKMERYEEMAAKGVELTKIWVDIHDNVPPERPEHWEASGQEVPYDQPFEVGGEKLMYPCDQSLGASGWNIYNCRCDMKKGKVKFHSVLPKHLQGSIKVHVTDD